MNPLLPSGYDIVWSIIAVATVLLAVVALVSLSRAAKRLTAGQALVWVLVIVLMPVIGAVAWLAVGRRASAPTVEP